MKRGHTANHREIVQEVRERFENFTISTDIIVGFPSETKKTLKNSKLIDETNQKL